MARSVTLPPLYPAWRFVTLVFLVCAIAGLLWGRVFRLHITDKAFLQNQSELRTIREVAVPVYRGMVTDRYDEPLAVSTPVQSIWMHPRLFDPTASQITELVRMLNTPLSVLREKQARHRDKEFVYVKRHVEPAWAKAVADLKIPGIYLETAYKRYYPAGEVTGQLLGFTDIDDKGQEGMELALQELLQGVPGVKRVLKDRMGHVVENIGGIRDPKPGQTVVLTIDKRLQYAAYRALKAAVLTHRAAGGAAIIWDPQQGDVLALVNQPVFNPNAKQRFGPSQWRNRAVTDAYEPGSVMKIFSMAAVLESGKFPLDYTVHTEPGHYQVGEHTVKDVRNFGPLDLSGVIRHSSNVGISQLVLQSAAQTLLPTFSRFGFGQLTGSGFPGESPGVLYKPVRAGSPPPFMLATLSFGYAMSATPLQLARAYGALAAGGCVVPVRFTKSVGEEPLSTCQRVIAKGTADTLLQMLEQVVQSGGAKKAAVPGYRVAGKTGTAKRVGKRGYENRYNAIFAGIAPLEGRRLVGVVLIEDPQAGGYYGGEVAAPVFRQMMQAAVQLLGIPPSTTSAAM